jgi:hypothetical protein
VGEVAKVRERSLETIGVAEGSKSMGRRAVSDAGGESRGTELSGEEGCVARAEEGSEMGVDADLELKVVLITERKVGRVIDHSPGEELLEKDPGKVCATGEGNTSSVGGGSTKEGSWSSGVNKGAGDGSREGC